ncbi:hypothetical protein DMI70_17740 [Escherichia coli]|nr:hypothetical protein [Escherichia coli]
MSVVTKPKDFNCHCSSRPGLVDIHDRRPRVLSPEAAREWMRQEVGDKEASEIAASGCVPANQFTAPGIVRGG